MIYDIERSLDLLQEMSGSGFKMITRNKLDQFLRSYDALQSTYLGGIDVEVLNNLDTLNRGLQKLYREHVFGDTEKERDLLSKVDACQERVASARLNTVLRENPEAWNTLEFSKTYAQELNCVTSLSLCNASSDILKFIEEQCPSIQTPDCDPNPQ